MFAFDGAISICQTIVQEFVNNILKERIVAEDIKFAMNGII